MPAASRTCPPIWERRGRNPVDVAAVCLGRPADDVVDGATGAIVEAEGGHAHGWQWPQGRGSRGLRCCRLYRITAVPWVAAAAGVAPTRVLRNCTSSPVMRPIMSRAVNRGSAGLGHLRFEFTLNLLCVAFRV